MLKEFDDPVITAKDIILPAYKNEPVPRNVPFGQWEKPPTNQDLLAFDSYLSTPLFIKRLTQISDELIAVPNQQAHLRAELRKVNA